MKLVIIFLNKIELLEEILTAFLEIGVSGATVLDSVGMGRIISQNIPIFAGLQETFAGSSPSNKTIFSIVEEHMVENIFRLLSDIERDFDEQGASRAVCLSVDGFFGLKPGS